MANSEWDKHLRDLLGDFKSEGEPPHWEELAQQLDSAPTPSDDADPLQDEHLKESLSNFKPNTEIEGWDRIEASLNEANRQFDENVRRKINHYEAPYDPLSWPLFLKHLSASKLLRAKLIGLKVVEFAAILLLLFTVVNMGRLGQLPFETPLFEEKDRTPPTKQNIDENAQPQDLNNDESSPGFAANLLPSSSEQGLTPKVSSNQSSLLLSKTSSSSGRSSQRDLATGLSAKKGNQSNNTETSQPAAVKSTTLSIAEPSMLLSDDDRMYSSENSPIEDLKATLPFLAEVSQEAPIADDLNQSYITTSLESLSSLLRSEQQNIIPEPLYVRQVDNTFLEFGIITQIDYNHLRMPEDRLYSAGKQIVFPQQGIPSHGFGAGFTLAIGHPIWALETGIIYNTKDFKPGRQLIVGGAFDNGSVDFEAMRLQIVSVPVQYRYRFDPKGRLKAYALAGFGLNLIVQSDIDVLIKYHFPSLSAGGNPNNNPDLAQTIRETRRISEHIRDGAPFSTKSFFSANVGIGVEYSISSHKTLFLQTAYQYQIPNLKFSNNNGKHIRSVSLQAGVRTPLGS